MRSLFPLVFLASSGLLAQAGQLDATFGTGGIVTTEFAGGIDQINALAVQSDGKIVAAGSTYDLSVDKGAIVRYNSDGTLDNGFGGDGKVTLDLGSETQEVLGVAAQVDGKIVVGGSYQLAGEGGFFAARLNSDGSLDPTFNGSGSVQTIPGIGGTAYTMALQPDGKILVGGVANVNNALGVTVVRYNTDGSLDTGFDGDGYTHTDIPGHDVERAYSIAVQADGRIVVAGMAGDLATSTGTFLLLRHLSDGSLDNSFDGDGILLPPATGIYASLNAVVIQPDQRILAAGGDGTDNWSSAVLIRVGADGSYDTGLGGSGLLELSPDDSLRSCTALVVEPNGGILLGGTAFYGAAFALEKRHSDGTVDNTFAGNGIVATPLANWGALNCLTPDGSGRILAGGYSRPSGNNDMTVARYTDGVTGIAEAHHTCNVRVVPLLANDAAWLEMSLLHEERLSCALLDATGRLARTYFSNAHRAPGAWKDRLDLTGLDAGEYLLRVVGDEEVRCLRLVVQH